MIDLIVRDHVHVFPDTIQQMYRLRHKVFSQRLGWVDGSGDGIERDNYDDCDVVYLIHRSYDGRVGGCLRLLPTLGPNMLRDTFPELMRGEAAPASDTVWETSRFSIDHEIVDPRGSYLKLATSQLLCGLLEFGLANGLTETVAVYDVRMERILLRAGCPMRRIGEPITIGSVATVAGFLEISPTVLKSIRRVSGINAPVLRMAVWPTMLEAA